MKSPICEMLGAEFPLVAFSHCKDVVVAVSKAGGVGVLGAVGMSPEILEQELNMSDSMSLPKNFGRVVNILQNYSKAPIRIIPSSGQ